MAVPLFDRRLLTAEEFRRMADTGFFSEEERVELVHGELVKMSPIGASHAAVVRRLNRRLNERLGLAAVVDVQNPLFVGAEQSELYPDLMLLRPPEDVYSSRVPEPSDVFLVIEVADTSVAYDRDVKVPIYAEAGIPEVWLVDLNSETIIVFRRPSPSGYQDVHQLRQGDVIFAKIFPDEHFSVAAILG